MDVKDLKPEEIKVSLATSGLYTRDKIGYMVFEPIKILTIQVWPHLKYCCAKILELEDINLYVSKSSVELVLVEDDLTIYRRITYCPFCGKKIEIIEKEKK